MAERSALGPAGYWKLLRANSGLPKSARFWIMHTGTLSDAWPCSLHATGERLFLKAESVMLI